VVVKLRLQKIIAQAGIASRRKAEELIKSGRVTVNGTIVRQLGFQAGEGDVIAVDGREIKESEKKVYIMLNKPPGYVSTVRDQFSRKTVLDLVKGIRQRIYPVGRLDYETSGLLLLTNDGELTHKLTHPGYETKKVYEAELEGVPSRQDIEKFEKGLDIGGYITAPSKMLVKSRRADSATVEITIHEGKNRQVRRMCEIIGHPVKKLKRISEGEISLGNLKEGQWRYLSPHEVAKLIGKGSNSTASPVNSQLFDS
jgi:23S rRNA pseudouridine2605 synthase